MKFFYIRNLTFNNFEQTLVEKIDSSLHMPFECLKLTDSLFLRTRDDPNKIWNVEFMNTRTLEFQEDFRKPRKIDVNFSSNTVIPVK